MTAGGLRLFAVVLGSFSSGLFAAFATARFSASDAGWRLRTWEFFLIGVVFYVTVIAALVALAFLSMSRT